MILGQGLVPGIGGEFDTDKKIQFHIRVLETSQENISSFFIGLEYLINISYVDDTHVFKVCFFSKRSAWRSREKISNNG
ncbi:hypothetical protein L1987_54332 [Smallanthus sonchifolius]|uniref:Uncharacterized protein n=1 Tax=Smallanthus sonchifolius TaxID=185202 RepID=A0ACB9E6V7_9ASTR|nr:hypothetical protein L1987_54332 [Smallanthus sonchifolius]